MCVYISKYRNLIVFLLFILLSIIAVGVNPFTKETIGPFDLLVSYPGYSSISPKSLDIIHKARSDVLDSGVPNRIREKKEFYDIIKNPKANKLELVWMFYKSIWRPSKFLFLVIPNNPLAYYCAMLFKLIMAGFGTYLFLRLFLSFLSSIWGGIVYMLCGFHVAWLFWQQVDTSLWIPWLLWAAALYLKSDHVKYLFLVLLVSVFMIKGGFPSVAAYGFYCFSLFILIYNIINWKNIRYFLLKTITPFIFVIFAFLLSIDFIFNLMNNLKDVDLSYRTAIRTALHKADLINLFKSTDLGVETAVYSGLLAFIFSLASLSFLWVRKRSRKVRSVYVFALVLMPISILLAYGLIDRNLISKIPGISLSNLNRISVIIGLSIALLSSFFIERLIALKTKNLKVLKLLIPCLVLLLVFQFYDQKKYFNKFNGPVSSEYFYPKTPSVDYVKQNIRHYQSVIADNSFNVAGIFGAYDLFEWYAHGFKTVSEKKLLKALIPRSLATPTAYTISAENIKISSPLMNLFAVKYIIINADKSIFFKNPYFFRQPVISHSPSPSIPAKKLYQHFSISEIRSLAGVNILVTTFRRRIDSDVELELYDSEKNVLIAIAKKNKRFIKDNRWVYFEFKKEVKLNRGKYKFSLALVNKNTNSRLSGWATKRKKDIDSYLTANGNETGLSLKYILHGSENEYKGKYKVHQFEQKIAVVENLKCPEGPYLISDLDKYPPLIKLNNLKYETVPGEKIIIDLPNESSGYLIIPRPTNKHRVFVDGKQRRIGLYLDVFPAIKIQDNTRVIFEKKPFYFVKGSVISIIVLFVLVIFYVFIKKKFPELRIPK